MTTIRSPGRASLRRQACPGRHADHERAIPGVGVATGEGDIEFQREGGEAFVQTLGKRGSRRAGQADGHHDRLRSGGHRSQVAEVHGQRLVAYLPGSAVGAEDEVDAVGEHVDRDHRAPHRRRAEHGGVIACGHLQPRMRWELWQEPVDKIGFHAANCRRRTPQRQAGWGDNDGALARVTAGSCRS